jgi:diguanylate cyclase (GGDEF)-like protein
MIVTMIGFSLSFRSFLSDWIIIYLPTFAITVMIVRMIYWNNIRKEESVANINQIKKDLRSTALFAPAIILSYSLLVIFAQNYGTQSQMTIAIIVLWSVAMIFSFSISVLPTTSILVIFVATVPVSLNFLINSNATFAPLSSIFLMLSLLVIHTNRITYHSFVETIIARWKLSRKNTIVSNERELANWIAHTDALTGLPNRRSFNKAIDEYIQKLRQDKDNLFAVAIVDLDGFKPINDVHGHSVGDAVLIEVGKRLTEVIGKKGFVARLGGDEFAIIAHNLGTDNEVLEFGKLVSDSLRPTFQVDTVNARLSGSCGFHIVRDQNAGASCILERADLALYKAKSCNRGSTEIFSGEMAEQMLRRSLIEQALREAIHNNSITVHFQPIVDMNSRETVGMEALARWKHDELGQISPALFIPIAEHAGLIAELTANLFEKAIQVAKTWPQDIFLSFNLSAEHLTRPSAGLNVLSVMLQNKFSPERLEIEVTETAIMKDLPQARTTISNLQKAGVRISLDDFGAGYSSMGQVRDLPFDKIKIDKSFVDEVCKSQRTRGLVSSIIGMCENLNISCVAEGIEHEEQRLALAELGCKLGQGFLFSKPMSGEESTMLFANEHCFNAKIQA